MPDLTLIIAEAGTEWLYILLVVAILAFSFLAERVKSAMNRTDPRSPVPPRPTTRRHPTSLPRPIIPPLDDAPGRESHPRPAVPPVIPRPRPPVRPPVPSPRPTGGPPEVRRPGPPRPRTVEERKAVIRGEAAPPPPRPIPAPSRPQPVPPPPQEPETWARLAKFGAPVSVSSGQAPPADALKQSAPQPAPGHAPAESFRELTPADLQRAFVLKEILEPPLALRD